MLPCMFYVWPVSLGLTISLRSDISFKEGFMVIKVFKSKNDQLRRGDEVVISQLSGSACLDELLKRYLAMFRIPLIQKTLFSSPFLGKGS